ncbi:tetratricopeptide repeat protein [Elusimicrobiota bacterium]
MTDPVSENKTANNRKWLIGLFVFFCAFLVYSNTFQGDFMYGDDEEIVLRNAYLQDWKHWPKLFTENYKAGAGTISNYYRPFQMMMYMFIVQTIGVTPWPFHFTNVLFHALCGLFIYLLLFKVFEHKISPVMAGLAALIWVVHPIHVEEVAIPTGVCSPAHLFWILAGILAFLKAVRVPSVSLSLGGRGQGEGVPQKWMKSPFIYWYMLAMVSFILAVLTKESAIVFPALVLACHIVVEMNKSDAGYGSEKQAHKHKHKKRPISAGKSEETSALSGLAKKLLYLHLPFWVLAGIYVILRLTALNFANTLDFYTVPNEYTQNILYRLYTLWTIIGFGLKILIVPMGLHPERSWPVYVNFWLTDVVVSLMIITALIAGGLFAWKKNRAVTLGIFWFFASYSPMSNLVAKINAIFWEHWFYTPSVGLIISGVGMIVIFAKQKIAGRILAGIAVLAVIALGASSYLRNPNWQSPFSYYSFILKHEPNSGKTWNNLAIALANMGKHAQAIECYTRAINIADQYPQTHHNLANSYQHMGHRDMAEKEFLKAIKMKPSFYHSHLALAEIYIGKNDRKLAIFHLEKVMEIYPYIPRVKQALEALKKN